MVKFDERVLIILSVSVLAVHPPAEAWYKQAARPNYYSVGRASGLLAGIRRSAIRREGPDTGDSTDTLQNQILDTSAGGFELKDEPFCVKEVLPDPQSCELIQDWAFRCQAAVVIELKSRNCLNA